MVDQGKGLVVLNRRRTVRLSMRLSHLRWLMGFKSPCMRRFVFSVLAGFSCGLDWLLCSSMDSVLRRRSQISSRGVWSYKKKQNESSGG